MTTGNTQAWDATLRTFCDPGDSILVEEYTFAASLEAAKPLEVNCIPVSIDDHGIVPEKLDELLNNWDAFKKKPKLLYTIPTGQNPTGSTLSAKRREAIYKIACKHDFIIVEDEPYYFLQMGNYKTKAAKSESSEPPVKKFTQEKLLQSLVPSFLHFDTEGRVVRLDSLSKVLAPGVRIGWIVAQKEVIEKYVYLNEVSIQSPSGFSQSMVHSLLTRWGQSGYLEWLIELRHEYTIKRDFTMDVLTEVLPKSVATVVAPTAGMFFSIVIDGSKHPDFKTKFESDPLKVEEALFESSVKDGSLMVPGSWFQSPNFKAHDDSFFFRGTYAAVPLDNLKIGLTRFGETVKKFYGL
ncbi:unnamed protein product [Ambrosiozyma monospora]|uniref:Unnamed protein product n=1 Tax=Ambrosiozyma monospora TaxID=43982 RepID=A0ACB5T8Z4_AMBMO|nr:unnamed protein product [Ambrosiozyma monospora]